MGRTYKTYEAILEGTSVVPRETLKLALMDCITYNKPDDADLGYAKGVLIRTMWIEGACVPRCNSIEYKSLAEVRRDGTL